MIKTNLTRGKDKKELYADDGYSDFPTLMIERYAAIYGNFKSQVIAAADTYDVIDVDSNEAIILTDLIISAEKKNAGTITIQFTDGVETEAFYLGTTTDAPINVGISFQGHWQGWKGASLQVVTSQAIAGNISIGYFKVPQSKTLTYSEWDARR